jgi:beta-glucosidase
MTTYRFPEGFVWGAATSAFQIEGSPVADGARPSIQHRYAHTPGNTQDGQTGDRLADHYHRWPEDVALMKDMGLQHYQYSIAWPRVIPEGTGKVNQAGLDFYDRLTDALLEGGITPTPILHVWDLPGDLQDRGGWANRDSAEWFVDFATVVFDLIGDRATHWFTICEPSAQSHGGYLAGILAPAMKDLYADLRAAHHINLAHGRAVQAFRASGAAGLIGTAISITDVQPSSEREEDVDAARRYNIFDNLMFTDPVMLGNYPAELEEWFGDAWSAVGEGDLQVISEPNDFLGITYYSTSIVSAGDAVGEDGASIRRGGAMNVQISEPDGPKTGLGWPIRPEGLINVLRWLRDRYGNPSIIVTENGGAFTDTVTGDGTVDDPERLAFIRDHLVAAHAAIEEGIALRGWYVWSLLDTWEFWLGVQARFGLIHIDYDTLKRTVKTSGRWFRDVMADNGFEAP